MSQLKTADEIHEQQINEIFKEVPQEERQRILSKFQNHRGNYLNNLREFQKEVDEYVRRCVLNKEKYIDALPLFDSLKKRQLENEQLDFDSVMTEYIQSEYDDEDHFFVTSDDPHVQQLLAESGSTEGFVDEELDESTLERLAGGDPLEVQRIKKRLEQEREENADQAYEFDHPIRLTKQQAIEIFTGQKRVAKQFKFVTSGLYKSFEKSLGNLTGAIGQEELDSQFYKRVNKQLIEKAIQELKNFEDRRIEGNLPDVPEDDKKKKKKKKKKQTKLLFSPSYEVIMLVNIQEPTYVNIPPFTIPLKHHIYDAEEVNICVITRDAQKDTFKQLIAEEPYAPNTKVLTIRKLMTQYKAFEKKELLRKSYDLFYVEKEINSMMPSLLGKSFYRKIKKGPQPVTAENLKQYIEKDITGTKTHLQQAGDQYIIRVGKLDDSIEHIAENVVCILKEIPKHVPNGGSLNIAKILLKTFASPSLPIYFNPNVKLNTVIEQKQFANEKKWLSSEEAKLQVTDSMEKHSEEEEEMEVQLPNNGTQETSEELLQQIQEKKQEKSKKYNKKRKTKPSKKDSLSKKRKQ
jgi:ribosomal protein L1